jgi:hypothetical protein
VIVTCPLPPYRSSAVLDVSPERTSYWASVMVLLLNEMDSLAAALYLLVVANPLPHIGSPHVCFWRQERSFFIPLHRY